MTFIPLNASLDADNSELILHGNTLGNEKLTLSVEDIKKELAVEVKTTPEDKKFVKFEDEKLKNAILDSGYDENKQGIDKNDDGLISKEEIATMIDLFATNRNIRSVVGLENAVNVKVLGLFGNEALSDITPLKELTKIELLVLQNTGVTLKDKFSFLRFEDDINSIKIYEDELSHVEIIPNGLF